MRDWKTRHTDRLYARGYREFGIRADGSLYWTDPAQTPSAAIQLVLQTEANAEPRVNYKPRSRSSLRTAVQALTNPQKAQLQAAADAWGDQQDLAATGADLVILWLRQNPDAARQLSPPVPLDGDEPE